ncbi:MAG TPA: Xaa-Pro peptidase family protein [Verrucomicrobiae bacterium]|jgi:Xaa-Pro aminopeptidase|nr:Xaa-Pro peptidase family protein [Verrucomicrobiae bacterium]
MNRPETFLIVADSERDANMLYATGLFVPDPFIYLRSGARPIIVLSDLEIDRARKQAPHCRAVSLSAYQQKLRRDGVKSPRYAHVIREILRENKIRRPIVPDNFPLGLAKDLKKLGIKLKPRTSFFPKREIKSADEVRKISAALTMAEVGMAEGMEVLRRSKIARNRNLIYHGLPLTSEKLRAVIDCAILQACGLAANTIVAGGKQACDPHERGHGRLRANEPIIIDIFPRSQKTGYFGDITRTVVRGRASDAVKKLYDTVFQGQKIALQKVSAGTSTKEIHQCVQQFFAQRGYTTGKRNGRMEGFFHGTGHGLGLEIHEAPRMGASSNGQLKAGQVMTVEPGLYYPEIGGVRLEDVALVTASGAKNLTRFEKVLEI